MVRIHLPMQETKDTGSSLDTRDAGSIPGVARSSAAGNGNTLHYSCMGNFMQRAWQATVNGATKSWT